MAGVQVQLKLRGINAVMTSREVTSEVVKAAQRIQRAAGPDFEVNIAPHKYTARAYVRAKNAQGALEEARNKVLTRALDAGRSV